MVGELRPFGELFAEGTRNGLTRPKAVRGAGVKMVNMGELFAHSRIKNAAMDRVPLNDAEAEKFLLHPGDLLFARQSLVLEGAGKCSIFLGDDEPVTFESHVTRVRLDEQKADPSFYFYYLQSHHGQSAIRSIVEQGAGASGIRGSDLQSLKVLWYPPAEQHAIARILGAQDDKIELNRRMNQTLEAMTRALFRSWFVDFDGVPQEDMQESGLGLIPKGWRVGTLGDVAEHPRRSVQPEEIEAATPYIALEHMPKRCIALADWGMGVGLESNKYEFKRGEILFGKLRPYFHKVGVAPLDGVCSTDIVVIAPKSPAWFGFVLVHASSDEFVEYTNAGSTGTKMPRTSWREMSRYAVVLPPESIAIAFNQQVQQMTEKIISNIHESRSLAALRDTLLPRLISGQLRVKQ